MNTPDYRDIDPALPFVDEKLKKIFEEKKLVIDIGGGLRADPRNNRGVQRHAFEAYTRSANYKILDRVADYHPDIVGDICDLPLEDESVDAILCLAVLEHVEDPLQAMREIRRVLKKGGYCLLYVPFLYYYHPLPGYYGDFFRFTYDGVKLLARGFSSAEIQNVRGAFATVMNLISFFSKKNWFDFVDRLVGKTASKQTSGYNIFLIK